LIPALLLPLAATLVYFVLLSHSPVGRVIYGVTKVFDLAWPLIALFFILRTGLPKLDLGSRVHLRAIPLGLLTGGLIVAVMFLLLQTPLGDIVRAGGENIKAKADALGFLDNFLLFALFISLFNSFVEEYYWRWFVFNWLRRVLPLWGAYLTAGVAFGAYHVVVISQFFPFGFALFLGVMVGVGGLIWSWMLQRQHTLAGAWLSHMIVDLGVMAIGYRVMGLG